MQDDDWFDPAVLPSNPYLLLTPGPLSTTKKVKAAMLRDWCTWDDDYKCLVQDIREELVSLATKKINDYSCVLMQGSGTFCIESVVGSSVPRDGKLLVLVNGAYGMRIVNMAKILEIDHCVLDSGELMPPDNDALLKQLQEDDAITHVALVHSETTTGILNPLKETCSIIKEHDKTLILDAMSSFGGVQFDAAEHDVDFLVSSANKCIQGCPGFGFIIATRDALDACQGNKRSLSLDLHDQWTTMEQDNGKWRFTSPTHVVHAFKQALKELEAEGGIPARHRRYATNQAVLARGMRGLGFAPLELGMHQGPIITTFHSPDSTDYDFSRFYRKLKDSGFVIYPGKVTTRDTFRIGSIGAIRPSDMRDLVSAVEQSIFWE